MSDAPVRRIAAAALLLSLVGLWLFQARHTNSALNGFFPHHKTFTALWFDRDLATAYRDVGREVVDRFLGLAP